MAKLLVISFLILFFVIGFITKNNITDSYEQTLPEIAKLKLPEKSYTYEFYTSKKDVLNNSMVSENVELTDTIAKDQYFIHQPTPLEGTNELIESKERLPAQVLPGVEFIETEGKPFFNGTNAGKYVSVVPDIPPLLVREELPLLKQSIITVEYK